jgi:HlyD family secretion protein
VRVQDAAPGIRYLESVDRRIAIGGVLVAIVAIALFFWFTRPRAPSLTVAANGRLEGYETDLGAKVGGKIVWVGPREGALVKAGQIVARLDDAEQRAVYDGAVARILVSERQSAEAAKVVAVLAEQGREAALGTSQAAQDANGRIAQARASLAAAQAQTGQAGAQLAAARAQLKLATTERDRDNTLLATGDVSRAQVDRSDAAFDGARAQVAAQERALASASQQADAARGALNATTAALYNPKIKRAEGAAVVKQIDQARAQIATAVANERIAAADKAQAQAALDNLVVRAPIDAVVVARAVEPGAVVAPGKVLLTVLDLRTVYLRGFVPEGQIGSVRVGQAARVYLDSDPKKPLRARVSEIDSVASFTPENVYLKDDRVTEVFGVRLAIDEPAGYAKPGMPADGEILIGGAGDDR